MEVGVGEGQLVAGELHVVCDADVADVAAGRAAPRACIIDSWVPRGLDGGVCAEPVGEVLDPCERLLFAFHRGH